MDDSKPIRIYLCGGLHCTARGHQRLLQVLTDELWACQLDQQVEVRVSGCQDRCDFGPNATVWPGPQRHSQLTPAAIKALVAALRR